MAKRISNHLKNSWLNPVPDDHWEYTSSVCLIKEIFEDRMYPYTERIRRNGRLIKMNDLKVENYGIKWHPFTLKIPFIHIKF